LAVYLLVTAILLY